jgi:DNA uptake protein ComE-like DNA-binding protein
MPFSPSVQYYRANLNSASFDTLVRVGKLDPKQAKALVQHRPYRSWDEIEQVPGFDRHVAYSLQESSYLGPSVSSKSSEESGCHSGPIR